MPSRYLVLCSALAAGLIAGCGGSSNSDTAHLQPAPSASQTLTYSATVTATTSTSTTPTFTTPTSGPLSKEPTITLPKGPAPKKLVTTDLITGTGATVKSGDTITVNYLGELYSTGKEFDSSWSRKTPFTTQIGVGAVIKGWDQGLIGMKVGGRRELIIPPALGYGPTAQATIPPNSTLIFVIDLLGVTAASGATGASG